MASKTLYHQGKRVGLYLKKGENGKQKWNDLKNTIEKPNELLGHWNQKAVIPQSIRELNSDEWETNHFIHQLSRIPQEKDMTRERVAQLGFNVGRLIEKMSLSEDVLDEYVQTLLQQ